MGEDFDTRRMREYPFHAVEVLALRFVKCWHRFPLLAEALWYRGVNLGELNEFELFAEVLPLAVSSAAGRVEESADPGITALTPTLPPESGVWRADTSGYAPAPGAFALERRRRREAACNRNAEGEALWRRGDAAAAARVFEEAIVLWNREALFFNNLGAALFGMNQLEQAHARFWDALHLRPDYGEAWDNLHVVARILGNDAEIDALEALFRPRDVKGDKGD